MTKTRRRSDPTTISKPRSFRRPVIMPESWRLNLLQTYHLREQTYDGGVARRVECPPSRLSSLQQTRLLQYAQMMRYRWLRQTKRRFEFAHAHFTLREKQENLDSGWVAECSEAPLGMPDLGRILGRRESLCFNLRTFDVRGPTHSELDQSLDPPVVGSRHVSCASFETRSNPTRGAGVILVAAIIKSLGLSHRAT